MSKLFSQQITAPSRAEAWGVLTDIDLVLCMPCWEDGACPGDTNSDYYVSRWLTVGRCEHCDIRFGESA